jgi:hypothetical protein
MDANLLRRAAALARSLKTAVGHPRLWAPPGHFYSPIVDPSDPVVGRVLSEFGHALLPATDDLRIDHDSMTALLPVLSDLCTDIPFPDERTQGYRFYFDNPAFSYGDATVYFGMLRWLRPNRVIEVGCGFSSCLLMDTNDYFFGGSIELTFIDPNPKTLLDLLGPSDPYRECLLPQRLQDTDVSVFGSLEANDILFIDSSHVSKMGSDVNDYMFRILPHLMGGVVVHIHDVPYPFDYPPEWILQENRSWNEAYLLRAFLQYNHTFDILYFNHYISREDPEELSRWLPACMKNGGASIWLRKKQKEG